MRKGLNILMEASKSDLERVDRSNLNFVEAEQELLAEYNDIDEVGEDPIYDEENVPVFAIDDEYVIEADVLGKYMKSSNIDDVYKAVSEIARHNELSTYDISVLIESDNEMYEMISEAKKSRRDKDIVKSKEFIIDLKNSNIKLKKKKSKSKKRK